MQEWKERLLSQSGKEVMIKAVIQSIPTYSMNVFCLPLGLIKDIKAMIRKFWWENQDNTRKMQWVKWRMLCSSKSLGGMGFRDLQQFNDALLGKQVWRLVHEEDTLLCRVFKPKYFPSGCILDDDINPRSSFAWKSIMQARDVICKGARWRVGDGSSIDIWKHRWLDSSGGGKILSPRMDSSLAVVKDLFITGTKMWNSDLLDQMLKSMPVSLHTDRDALIWPWTLDGVYSVKSAYRILANESLLSQAGSSNPEASKPLWNGIWRLKVPNKVKHFLWRASNESLPTKFNLYARHILPDNNCGLCEEFPEDVIHCLWLCDHVKSIWLSDQTLLYPRTRKFRCFGDLVSFVLSKLSSGTTAWTRRNRLRERQPVWDVSETMKRARELLQEFNDVQDIPTRSVIPQVETRW